MPGEGEATDTITCESPYCDREVYEAATVDVVAGAIVGEWDDPEPHVGVSGVDSDSPVIEKWCVTCAEEEFGIGKSAYEKRVEQVKRYITARTVAAFALGVALTLIVSSMMMV